MSGRTIAIGDVHGDRAALSTLLSRLPALDAEDTLVFVGDYVDRGPDSLGVVRDLQELPGRTPARIVTLRGNHEDKWVDSYRDPDFGFLMQVGNGGHALYRSVKGGPALAPDESLTAAELKEYFDVRSWFPADVHAWMEALPLWYEDEHAIYVHAGLDGEGTEWKHPRDSRPKTLLWMREPDFFTGYSGKRLVFGHTPVRDLPLDHLGTVARWLDDPRDVWVRGDLVGIDTAAGKGGFLSAIELPRGRVYESR